MHRAQNYSPWFQKWNVTDDDWQMYILCGYKWLVKVMIPIFLWMTQCQYFSGLHISKYHSFQTSNQMILLGLCLSDSKFYLIVKLQYLLRNYTSCWLIATLFLTGIIMYYQRSYWPADLHPINTSSGHFASGSNNAYSMIDTCANCMPYCNVEIISHRHITSIHLAFQPMTL